MTHAAALPAERYTLTKLLVGALEGAISVWGAIAWWQAGEYGQAVICGIAQFLAINAVIAGRRALSRETGPLPYPLFGLALVCIYFSHEGLLHAWGEGVNPAATFALASVGSFLFRGVDAIEQAPRRLSKSEREALADAAFERERAAARQHELDRLALQARVEASRAAPTTRATAPARREAPAKAPSRGNVTDLEEVRIERDAAVNLEALTEAVKAIVARGEQPSNRSVARELAVHRSKIERATRQFSVRVADLAA